MRIALQLSGQTRGKDEVFPALKKNILDVIDCDLYMYICKDQSSNGLLKLLDSLEIYPNGIFIKEDELIRKNIVRPISALSDASVQRYFQQLYGIWKVNHYRQISSIKYDWVIRSRVDLILSNSFPDLSKLDNKKLYIPSEEDYLGINDRFAFSSPEIMDIYCNMFNWIDSIIKKRHNAESNLKAMLEEKNIEMEFIDLRFKNVGKEEAQREKSKWKNFKFKESDE